MRVLWPTVLKADAGIVTRLGRVIHWLTAIIGIPSLLVGAGFGVFGLFHYDDFVNGGTPPYTYTLHPGQEALTSAVVWLVAGVLIYFFGRAFRYITAGE